MTKYSIYTTIQIVEEIEATSLNEAINRSRSDMEEERQERLIIRLQDITDISIKGYKSIFQEGS